MFLEWTKNNAQVGRDFELKVQEESYNAAKRYSDSDMKAIARVKLAGVMSVINGTVTEYRNLKT